MTKQAAIAQALKTGAKFVQMQGDGDYARWVVHKNYPGHSNFVWQVQRDGSLDRCR